MYACKMAHTWLVDLGMTLNTEVDPVGCVTLNINKLQRMSCD